MLDEQMKREIIADAFDESRNRAFAKADELAEAFINKHWQQMNVDQIIKFLMDVQKIVGPFPVSRKIPDTHFEFRL